MTTISNRGDIFAIANIIICELPVGKFFEIEGNSLVYCFGKT